MTSRLKRIHVAGFRSLRDVTVDLTPTTVLIGPNGSGKSNLLSALRMVSLMSTESLQLFVGEQGGASALLLFRDETISRDGMRPVSLGVGHRESFLKQRAMERFLGLAPEVHELVSNLSFFHFHDTSLHSPLRQNSNPSDDRHLRSDGKNLASFLYRLKTSSSERDRDSWKFIGEIVRRVAPFIKHLEPDLQVPDAPRSGVRLDWIDQRDFRFDVAALSDGTLRAIALITALTQPSSSLPKFIVMDEPELGLHPAAIRLVAALIRSVNDHRFIPYLQRHEFETLVLAALAEIDEFPPGMNRASVEKLRHAIRGHAPEEINDGVDTAPSKWLSASIPGYEKVVFGPSAVETAGLPALRKRCPRFNAWITKLEALGGVS